MPVDDVAKMSSRPYSRVKDYHVCYKVCGERVNVVK